MKTGLLSQHITMYRGARYEGEHGVCYMEYGRVRDVNCDLDCNYSYREFWF